MKYLFPILIVVGALCFTLPVPPRFAAATVVATEKPDWVVRAEYNLLAATRQTAEADNIIIPGMVERYGKPGLTKEEAQSAQLAVDVAYWHRCVAIKMLAEKRVP